MAPVDSGPLATLSAKFNNVKRVVVAVAGIGAVASGLVGYYSTYKTVTQAATAPSPASTAVNPLSILVLPLVNQTGDAQKAYVADALTTSLTSDLARIQNAYVIAPATALSYKGKALTVRQIGIDAGVRFVLQGSVLSSGEKVRINVTLADTQHGAALWTDTLDGETGNMFALQDQVTALIARSIGREMIIVAARDSEKRRSTPKAADLMMRVEALGMQPQTFEISQRKEALLRQVLALEPGNVRAMSWLADCLSSFQAGNFGASMASSVREAKFAEGYKLALEVRRLEPANSDAYSAIASYARAHDDVPAAHRAELARLALKPKDPSILNDAAFSYIYGGEPEKAIALVDQAIQLDPRHAGETLYVILARARVMRGEDDAAVAACLKSLDLNPTFPSCYPILAMIYTAKGDTARAAAAKAELLRLYPSYKLPPHAWAQSSSPAAYRTYFDTQFLPRWRKAGLPE